jgi:hypothetical protein
MGDYFKPMRRKIGVLLLAVTFLFTLKWLDETRTGAIVSIVFPLTIISAWCLLTKPRTEPTTKPETAHA